MKVNSSLKLTSSKYKSVLIVNDSSVHSDLQQLMVQNLLYEKFMSALNLAFANRYFAHIVFVALDILPNL